MAVLEWDKTGDRIYQTGIDRGVLYLPDGSGVPWNGLVSLTESFNNEVKAFYQNGIKYLEHQVPGEFAAELRAFTYPDELDALLGVSEDFGMFYHDQPSKRFGLSYRTLLGNDVDGTDLGYKIHIIYNILAIPISVQYGTLNESGSPITFGWSLTTIPENVAGRRPTSHVSVDSIRTPSATIGALEDRLYGTASTDASLPSISDLSNLDLVTITDNGDGTWTASGSDEFVYMTDSSTFEIVSPEALYLDADTYEISSSE